MMEGSYPLIAAWILQRTLNAAMRHACGSITTGP
jgi:hypothetical protein